MFLEGQIPSKKVVWGVFRRSNTFSEGSWIPRVYKTLLGPLGHWEAKASLI